jgi:uncharacterized UPF0146 family protein
MKASVITLTSVRNYGTQLQALATQMKLREFYDEVEFINYRRPDTYGRGLFKSYAKGSVLRGAAILPTMALWHFKFNSFQKRNLRLTPETFESERDFDRYSQDADVFFTGSDQVWNSGWNGGIIPPLYLSFIGKGKRKAAFSSSFGRDALSISEVEECKPYLDEFDKISVREKSGEKILSADFQYTNVTQIVDPTLSLSAEQWRRIEPRNKIREEYILIYSLNKNPELDKYAEKLAKKAGLTAYRFCTRLDQITKSGKPLVVPNILDFVTLIDKAKYVITDSFHATAFSMNLNTEVICILPQKYSGRLSEFLELVHQKSRILTDYTDFDIINRKTDFNTVNEVLEHERKRVNDFLASVTPDPRELPNH